MSKVDIFATGPGSQPAEADGGSLDYMPMPAAMETFAMPLIPEPEDVAELPQALAFLRKLSLAVDVFRVEAPAEVLDLVGLDAADRALVDQMLGEGEVSVVFDGAAHACIQESVLAGIWRVQYLDNDGMLIRDTIEIAAVPGLVQQAAFEGAAEHIAPPADMLPSGVQNAPPLIAELNHRIAAHRPGAQAHVINLSLLPHTEDDLQFLAQRLGQGPVTILSRGYGNCRIASTATRNVWWVQYFNSQDALILNTLEVADVPSVACAAQEDMEDSGQRLREILEVYA